MKKEMRKERFSLKNKRSIFLLTAILIGILVLIIIFNATKSVVYSSDAIGNGGLLSTLKGMLSFNWLFYESLPNSGYDTDMTPPQDTEHLFDDENPCKGKNWGDYIKENNCFCNKEGNCATCEKVGKTILYTINGGSGISTREDECMPINDNFGEFKFFEYTSYKCNQKGEMTPNQLENCDPLVTINKVDPKSGCNPQIGCVSKGSEQDLPICGIPSGETIHFNEEGCLKCRIGDCGICSECYDDGNCRSRLGGDKRCNGGTGGVCYEGRCQDCVIAEYKDGTKQGFTFNRVDSNYIYQMADCGTEDYIVQVDKTTPAEVIAYKNKNNPVAKINSIASTVIQFIFNILKTILMSIINLLHLGQVSTTTPPTNNQLTTSTNEPKPLDNQFSPAENMFA